MRKLRILILFLLLSISTYGCSKYFAIDNPKRNNDIEDNALPVNQGEAVHENKESDADSSDETEDNDSLIGYEESAKLRVEVEGTTEEITASLYHSPLGYRIIYDNERFQLSGEENGLDKYNAENPDSERYPDVYMRISTSESSDTIMKEFGEEQESITTLDGYTADYAEDVTINTYTAKHYKLKTGNQWDDIIRNFYIIESDSIHYIIETHYFLEAGEGYGARIAAMLDTFELYD